MIDKIIVLFCTGMPENIKITMLLLGLCTHLFVKVPRPGDSEGTESKLRALDYF